MILFSHYHYASFSSICRNLESKTFQDIVFPDAFQYEIHGLDDRNTKSTRPRDHSMSSLLELYRWIFFKPYYPPPYLVPSSRQLLHATLFHISQWHMSQPQRQQERELRSKRTTQRQSFAQPADRRRTLMQQTDNAPCSCRLTTGQSIVVEAFTGNELDSPTTSELLPCMTSKQ
jgi:hypothetical protein